MATVYGVTRNIEKSIRDYVQAQLTAGSWTSVNLIKTFAEVSEKSLPVVCIESSATDHLFVEIGSNSTYRDVSIILDIFALTDGQLLDLKDYIISKLKLGCTYYAYTLTSGVYSSVSQGRLDIDVIEDIIVNREAEKAEQNKIDRHRGRIGCIVKTRKVET